MNFSRFFSTILILSLSGIASAHDAGAAEWEWASASPESEGMSTERLEATWSYLHAHRTTALLIIRNDRIVLERYAPGSAPTTKHYTASMAKALVGGVSLAVALTDGLIALDDPASKYVSQWKDDPIKSTITIRHLGSHTSGLADAEEAGLPHEKLTGWKGDFWKRLPVPNDPFTIARDKAPVLFDPGTEFQYSNPGLAMLGYVTTTALKNAPQRDLRTLLRERVLRPIGVPDKDWSLGYGQTVNVDEWPLVGTWGGGSFTARAVARVGRLMLRQGDWEGKNVLDPKAVQAVISDAGTPGDGAMGWWSNNDGSYPMLPRDAFWGAGAGHQIVLVVPSLKLIAVRNGESLGPAQKFDAALREHFFGRLLLTVTAPTLQPSAAPYPRSPVIKGIIWAQPGTIIRQAKGSDNWPLTWADDDNLYTAYGDGAGFNPATKKLSLGLARVSGSATQFTGVNLRADSLEDVGDGKAGKKASGILMVDGILYLWARNAGNSQLASSSDHGARWTWSDWKFTNSFGCPTFLNFGRNYTGSRDGFVYVYSHDSDSAYESADRFVLARVPKDKITVREAYEFLQAVDPSGAPGWTRDIDRRGGVFAHPGKCYRSGITFNAALQRYLWCQTLPGGDARFQGGFGIYDAPEPWGPWTTVFDTELWDVGPGETCSFPTKWMSSDGQTVRLVFSGDDSFSVRQATLVFRAPSETRNNSQRPPTSSLTRVSIADGKWQINGEVTYRGAKAEGLLLNVRMVNATFEDLRKPEFDPEANTDEFVAEIPQYVSHGVRAFTLNLQGGTPGYEGAVNSAFDADGSLRAGYMKRVERVINACDRSGAVVILGCFYQRQDQLLRDEDTVRRGVVNVVNWIAAARFSNVVVEIANEFGHGGFNHRILRAPEGQVELVRLARKTAPALLVGTSGLGGGELHDTVARESDFLLIHFNNTPRAEIPRRIEALKRYRKPIVCNEDQKSGAEGAQAAELCAANGASWGLMLEKLNQHFPFAFQGAADDPVVYAALKALAASSRLNR